MDDKVHFPLAASLIDDPVPSKPAVWMISSHT